MATVLFFLLALIAIGLAWYVWELRQRKTHPMTGGMHEDITLPHDRGLSRGRLRTASMCFFAKEQISEKN